MSASSSPALPPAPVLVSVSSGDFPPNNSDLFSPEGNSSFNETSIPEQTKLDPALLHPLLPSELSLTLAIPADLSLSPFLDEFSKLQQALKKSQESEGKFLNKCRSLIKQSRAHSHKLNALSAMHQGDLKRKRQYQEEIEKTKLATQKIVEESREKREAIKKAKEELAGVASQLEADSAEHLQQQRARLAVLELEIARLTQLRDKERSGLTKLRAANIEKFQSLQDLLAQQSKAQLEFDQLESKMLENRALASKELKRKGELEKQMKEIQQRVAEHQQQIQHKKTLTEQAKKDLAAVQAQLQRSEALVQAHKEEYEQLSNQAQQENSQLVSLQEENEENQKRLKKEQKELDEERLSVKQMKSACETKLKMLEIMKEKVNAIAEETRQQEEEKVRTGNELRVTKDLLGALQYKYQNQQKLMDSTIREREVLAQQHTGKIDAIRQKEALLKIRQSTLKNTQNEHQGFLMSIRALTKILEELKAEKFSYELDFTRRQEQKARAQAEIEGREKKIHDYQQQILINEGKFRQQANLLESVRSDRNFYRKSLIEQQTEMNEMKRKFHHFSTQVKGLKGEIHTKETQIVIEHFQSQSIQNDLFLLQEQNRLTKASLQEIENQLKDQNKQIRQLAAIIADADRELKKQIQSYNGIINEQRVLNAHLVGRNQELSKIYEEIRLNSAILNKSQRFYTEKYTETMEFLQLREELQENLEEILADVEKFEELKVAIKQQEIRLEEERLKVRSLQEELKKPINIHRWRRLQDTNTETYSMIQRVRSLQKEIIEKQEKIQEKSSEIQEKEKLYVDLRKIVSRQVNPIEAEGNLKDFDEEFIGKRHKLKGIQSELMIFHRKCKELQYGIEKNRQDMEFLKIAYFEKRKKEQKGGAKGKAELWNEFEQEFQSAQKKRMAATATNDEGKEEMKRNQSFEDIEKTVVSGSAAPPLSVLTPAQQAGYYPIEPTDYQQYIDHPNEEENSPQPIEEEKQEKKIL